MNRIIKRAIIGIALVFCNTLWAGSLKHYETGIALNTIIPKLSVVDSTGQPKNATDLYGKKGLILVFFRSADWCPFCKKQLIEINQWNDKLNQSGYNIAAISYDPPEILAKFKLDKKIQFTLLADQKHQTINDFQVINQDYSPGARHYGIPYPGIMVVNNKGVLINKHFYEGYKMRMTAKSLYESLK